MEMSDRLTWAAIDSPLGDIVVAWSGVGLRRLWFTAGDGAPSPDPAWEHATSPAFGAGVQLSAYFAGQRADFDLPLDARGTDFQRHVWAALQSVPYGGTATYGQLAERIGRPGSARAVGGANNRNPLPIVVPCHRVVGADGSLTGYAGGLRFKRFLLDLEAGGARLALRACG